jgi:hypothetical protein
VRMPFGKHVAGSSPSYPRTMSRGSSTSGASRYAAVQAEARARGLLDDDGGEEEDPASSACALLEPATVAAAHGGAACSPGRGRGHRGHASRQRHPRCSRAIARIASSQSADTGASPYICGPVREWLLSGELYMCI